MSGSDFKAVIEEVSWTDSIDYSDVVDEKNYHYKVPSTA